VLQTGFEFGWVKRKTRNTVEELFHGLRIVLLKTAACAAFLNRSGQLETQVSEIGILLKSAACAACFELVWTLETQVREIDHELRLGITL
jgi:hypothetical protein